MRFGKTLFTLILATTGCGSFAHNTAEETPAGQAPPSAPPLQGTPADQEVSEEFGVFVAASAASEGADGSRNKPFGTLQAGLARAKELAKRVYVCGDTFKEALTIERGISMVGGFDCTTEMWRKGDKRTRIESPSSPAIKAEGIDVPTRLEGFVVVAPDGTEANPTSIGLHATGARALTIASSSIVAGRGADGAPGVEGVQLTFSQTAPEPGASDWMDSDITGIRGEDVFIRPRPRPANVGGAGAVGSCGGAPGIAGGTGGRGGKSGSWLSERCPICVSGIWVNKAVLNVMGQQAIVDGAPSEPGAPGLGGPATTGAHGASASAPGRWSPEGFIPGDGVSGTNGTPGAGGAGGAATSPIRPPLNESLRIGQAATGPGGGAGGCPGLAGTAGKGGGASVGALLVDSLGLVLDATDIVARDGGAGGRGTFGSDATAGGPPAMPYPGAGAAEPGHAGGRAGVSGSGAGGSSVGIAHRGGAPTLVSKSSVQVGKPGAGAPQAEKTYAATGETKTLPASVDGIAKDMLVF